MLKRYLFLAAFLAVLLALAAPINASGNPHCQSWNEAVRVRIAELATGEVIDFTATNYFVDGRQSAALHFTGGNDSGLTYNMVFPLSGSPHDRVWIEANLISGHIDTTVNVYNQQTGVWHVVEMRLHTRAPVSAYPYTFDANTGEYIRNTREVGGYLTLDGQMWFDLDHMAGLDVQAWNISTCAPRTPR